MIRLAMLAALCLPILAWGEAYTVGGYTSLEGRWFNDGGRWPGQTDRDNYSVAIAPEFSARSGAHQFRVVPFYRYDSVDSERTHGDLREAWWLWAEGEWEILAGVYKVFWGTTESRHLVDIINQTDLIEDIDEEQKLGQPMLRLRTFHRWGNLEFYWLPWFRERTFPGSDGRLRSPLVVEADNPDYESGAGEHHSDFALRYSTHLNAWDIGLHLFRGTDREPLLRITPGDFTFTPYYQQIVQFGADLQYTFDAWLLKLETIYRDSDRDSFVAAVAGMEYTFYQWNYSNTDVGVLVEYLYDDRDESSPVTPLNDDLFVGLRLSLNDFNDSMLLMGVIVDPDSGEQFFTVEGERRLSTHFKGEINARWFRGAEPDDTLYSIDRDSYLEAKLLYYF